MDKPKREPKKPLSKVPPWKSPTIQQRASAMKAAIQERWGNR